LLIKDTTRAERDMCAGAEIRLRRPYMAFQSASLTSIFTLLIHFS
jgi:hypothetical protein